MKPLLFYITAFVLLLNSFSLAQQNNEDDGIPVISDVIEYFSGIDGTRDFLTFNMSGKRTIKKIVNGVNFYGFYSTDEVTGQTLNEVYDFKIWEAGPEITNIGGGFSIVTNPFAISIAYYNSSFNLEDTELKFAIPPGTPDGKSAVEHEFKSHNVLVDVDYIAASLLWGYMFVEAGISVNLKYYESGSNNKFFFSAGPKAGILLKYKHFFAKASYGKYFINDSVFQNADPIQAKAGAWINF